MKIQACVRGHQERSWYSFQKECAVIIQSACRRFLVRKECHNECMVSILIAAAANSLRVRNAAKRLQHWWFEELWSRKEKEAALVIERFFIFVKKEVEREVKALKKKKKERRRRRKIKQSDDYILERAWLGVADDVLPPVPAAVPHQRAVPSHYPPADIGKKRSGRGMVQPVEEDAQSDVSGLTDLDFGTRNSNRKLKKSHRDIREDASLEEAFQESEAQLEKESRLAKNNCRPRAYPRRY